MSNEDKNKAEVFLDMLLAAMRDAACERKLTQLKTTITPSGKTKPEIIRIVIVPETMDVEVPKGMTR